MLIVCCRRRRGCSLMKAALGIGARNWWGKLMRVRRAVGVEAGARFREMKICCFRECLRLRRVAGMFGAGSVRSADTEKDQSGLTSAATVQIYCCSNPGGEAAEAARTILRHVRGGGRFRDVAVLMRRLDGYAAELQRVFSRYEIP